MGAGASQAESASGGAGAAGAQLPRYVGAAGESGGGVKQPRNQVQGSDWRTWLGARVPSLKKPTKRSAMLGEDEIYANQIGENNESRNRALPDVTEQQGKGHESREPHQESAEHGSGTCTGEDGSV